MKNTKPLWQIQFEGAWPMAVAFLGPDRVVAGNRNGELIVWDLAVEADASPKPLRRLEGHTNGVTRLAATADGKHLISASLDHTVRIWDADAPAAGTTEIVLDRKAREQRAKKERNEDILSEPGVEVEIQAECEILAEHTEWVNGLGLSRDGKRMITGDDNCQTIVWDFETRKEISRWSGYPRNWVSSAALTPDGSNAFVGEFGGRRGDFDRPPAQARIYQVEDGSEKVDLLKVQFPNVKVRDNSYGYSRTWGKFVKRGFIAADFSPDGKLLAVGQGGETDTGQIHLIETATGKLVRTVSGHRYGATDVKFSHDGQFVLSTGRDTMLRICQVSDGKQIAELGKSRGGQFKDWFSSVAISPDQKRLAASDIAGIVHVWAIA